MKTVYIITTQVDTHGHGESYSYSALATLSSREALSFAPAFTTRKQAEEYVKANKLALPYDACVVELQLR